MDESLNQSAVGAVSRIDDRAVVASAQRVLPQVEPQTRLLGFWSMARIAILREERANIGVVVDVPGRGRREWGLRECRRH
jgi:hypothetical protein